jgi:5-methylcytosine-specific restriction endonuclease McrA
MICQLCGVETFMDGNIHDNSCHIDHKIPISRGGENDTMNGRVLCKLCNQSKNSKLDEEFLKLLDGVGQ